MDQFNVITPTHDIDDLNNQYYNWCSLPYNFRMRSNEECIRKYGITNIELYERLKASIMAHKMPESDDSELIGSYVSESSFELPEENLYNFNIEDEEFFNKIQQVKELEMSPNIVIICPFKDPNIKEYTIEELNDKYNKYCLLTIRNKRFSDSYSLNIWGYTVYNMYEIMTKQIENIDKQLYNSEFLKTRRNNNQKMADSVRDLTTIKMMDDDIIGLMNIRLDFCCQEIGHMKILDVFPYLHINQDIKHYMSHKNYYDSLPGFVPFLTIDEAREYGIESEDIEDYYPGIEINEKSMKLARERQARWLEEHSVQIIDITKCKRRDGVVLESTQRLQDVYQKHNLYPVYIVLSYNKRGFTNILKKFGNLEYTHSGLSLDSDLKEIYTFNYKPGLDKDKKGFNIETLDAYIKINNDSDLMVLCFFVDKASIDKIKYILDDMKRNKSRTHYSFINLFRVYFGKEKKFDPNNLRMVCSQFVDYVLKMVNLDITNKANNLVTPDDFKYLTKNPKIFKIYEDLTRNYTDNEVENKIYSLFQSMKDEQISYIDMMKEACEYVIESYYSITENEEANKILAEIRELLTPESIFNERKSSLLEFKFPIRINDKGDIIVKLYKSLEEQYQEAHRLLKSYGSSNIEGIKHELARLFYVNAVIEKKVKKMDKADDNYKKMIDLRARVLNDFKKYFKIVLEKEPDFDFAEYFKKSEYYNGEVTIDGSIFKFTGALIKKLLKIIFGGNNN